MFKQSEKLSTYTNTHLLAGIMLYDAVSAHCIVYHGQAVDTWSASCLNVLFFNWSGAWPMFWHGKVFVTFCMYGCRWHKHSHQIAVLNDMSRFYFDCLIVSGYIRHTISDQPYGPWPSLIFSFLREILVQSAMSFCNKLLHCNGLSLDRLALDKNNIVLLQKESFVSGVLI